MKKISNNLKVSFFVSSFYPALTLSRAFTLARALVLLGMAFQLTCCASSRSGSLPTKSLSYTGLGAESVPAEIVKKFAPGPIASDLQDKLQKYLDIRAPGAGQLSADGKHLFFSWNVTGTWQIWRIDGANQFPKQMTGGKDPTQLSGITPDGKWLIVSRDIDGQENPGLYWMASGGGSLSKISHTNKVQAHLQWISDDSRWVYFSANDRSPDSYALYRFDLQDKKTELIFSEPGLWHIADVHRDGNFLLAKSTGSLWKEYYRWNLQNKKLVPLLGIDEKEEYEAQFDISSEGLLVLTNKFGEFRRLYRFKQGQFKVLSPDLKYDISSFSIDYPRTKIYVSYNDRGYTRSEVFSAKNFTKESFPRFPDADHVDIASITRTGRYISLSVANAQAPRTSYVYDWQTHKIQSWVITSVPEVDTSKFVNSTLESYPARDGTSIPMFVRRPPQCVKAERPCPVIVLFHGGPESQSVPQFSPRLQALVDEGFIVVEPNVRGSDGYGKSWLNADNGEKRLQVITDIEDAALFIRKKWAIQGIAPKLGVMGGSYGGYSTLMAMTYFAGSYDCGAAIVGMSNLVTFLQNTAPYRRILRTTEYGDLEKDREALVKLSPITYVDHLKGPLLISQGVQDPRVPVGEALQIYNILESKNLPRELILFADEGHGSQKRGNVLLELGHTIEFFKKNLGN